MAPTTSSPGSTSTGADSPVSSERSTHDDPCFTIPSAGIVSPGRTTTSCPGRSSSIGDPPFRPVDQQRRRLRPTVEQRPRCVGGASASACLEHLADEDQRDDHGGRVEVVVVSRPSRIGSGAVPVRRQRAERDQRIHRGRTVQGGPRRCSKERPARVEDDGRREQPCQLLTPRRMRQSEREPEDGDGQRHRHREPALVRPGLVGRRPSLRVDPGAVPDPTDRLHERSDVVRVTPALLLPDRRCARREVHRGFLDPRHPLERTLHPLHAGRAGHALDVEDDRVTVALHGSHLPANRPTAAISSSIFASPSPCSIDSRDAVAHVVVEQTPCRPLAGPPGPSSAG